MSNNSSNVLDLKLKSLIHACKASGNYKKLSVVGFILTSNIVDEISIKLGMRPRRKKDQEKIFEYLTLINQLFTANLKITVFSSDLIDTLKQTELLFLKSRGNLPYEYIKQLIAIYYELRKLEIPNMYKGMTGDDLLDHPSMGTLNFFSRRSSSRKKNENKFKPILQYTINQKEKLVRSKLNQKLTQSDLELAIQLGKIKSSLDKKRDQKITLQGSLKDNIVYEQSQDKLIGYLILGAVLISLLFGAIIITEIFLYPATMRALNNALLISLGTGILGIIIYRSYTKRGKVT